MSRMRERRIACLGDSNTFGYDPCAPLAGRYPPELRWTGRLAQCGWQVFNRGMNGACVPLPGQFRPIAEMLRSLGPLDAVTVMFGTNDLLRGDGARAAAARLAEFLAALRTSVPGPLPLLIAPPPLAMGAWVNDPALIPESEAFAACCRQLAAAQGAAFADAGEWGVGLTYDGVHFTPDGHAAFSRGLSRLLDASCPEDGPRTG